MLGRSHYLDHLWRALLLHIAGQRDGASGLPAFPAKLGRGNGAFEQRRGLRGGARVLLDGRSELAHAVRLLMHEELRVHEHTVPLGTTGECDRRGLWGRGTGQVRGGAGRGGVWGATAVCDGDGARGGAPRQWGDRGVLAVTLGFDHLPPYLLLEGVGAMRGRGKLGRGGAAGRMPGTVQGWVAPVFVPQAIEERRSLLDLAAPAGPMPEQLPHAVPHRGGSLTLVLAYAGLLEGYGADGDGVELLVRDEGEDLYVVETSDGLPVDVGHQLVGTETRVVCRPSLVYSLKRGEGEGEEGMVSWVDGRGEREGCEVKESQSYRPRY